MKAILTRCLTLASLIALSTALSADSRLTSTGASGFLYSDYLQTAASGRNTELQGSFVVENHRPFFANIGRQLPRRIVGEIKTLPLREWGLDYVFENRRPAHQTALAERGWRIADWLAEETLMAATESGRGGGLIRTLEFDLQSELGGRRGSAGLNVLGALRETADYDALAWQLRGFKTKDGGGGSAGLIYRWLPDETGLLGVNAFVDYETRNGDGFWRWSAGAEVRTAWADLFGNYYQGITDDRRRGDEWIYTADGYDVELHVHSPDLPWLVGEIAYFNWKGRYGDSADRGFRFGVKFKPATGVEVALEYERRNSDRDEDDGDNKKEWSGWVRYAGKISKPIRRLRSGGEYNNYEPRDYFFSPAEREYTQRIRKAKGAATDGNNMRLSFTRDAMPINLESADLDLEIDDKGSGAWVTGTANGQQISAAVVSPYVIPNAPLITLTHKDGTLTLTYPKTKTTAEIGSEVAVATLPDDFLHLADGNADITVGTGGGGTMFVAQYVNPDDFILRFGIPIINVTQRISLATTLYFPEIFPENAIFTLLDKNGMTISSGILGNLRASIQLAADPFFRIGTTPPIYYKAKTATGPFVVATLRGTGGGGGYVWTKEGSGELEINGNVVSIPAGANVSESGVLLSVRAVLNDSDNLNLISRVTPPITADFTVSYREIADLAAKFNPAARNVYGLAGEGAEIVAATITAAGGADAFTYAKTGGQLNVRSAGGNGGFGHAVIPASVLPSAAPGAELVLEAELSQPIPGGSSIRTIAFSLTVRYVGVNRISSPAFAAESGKAISLQSPTFYRVTALADDNAAMDIATLNEATGGGGNKTYAKVGSGGLNFNTGTRKVSIPANTPPTGQRLGLTVRIADSGAGSEVTPEVTVMLTVQYVSVNRINLGFDDPDGLVTVFGLRNNNAEVGSVARAVADGGFGGVTVGKAGNAGLGLRGTEIYIPANNPPQAAPGRALLITVSANDNAADDPNDITDAALATMTLRYVQVQELSGGYLPVNTNGNGQAQSGARAINGIHTVGMAAAVQNQFTVASLSVSGGVGDYQYRQIGGGNLSVDSNGQILMAANVQPSAPGTGAPFVIVVEADDRGTNDDVTPAMTLTLTVSYNTIVPIEARVMDTRDDAVPPEIPHTGGTVYFEHAGSDILTPFGTLVISGGFPSPVGDYSVTPSNPSGLTGISYDSGNKQLSMTKCDGSATKGIRLVIDDVGSSASTDLTEPLTVNFEVTSGEAQCVKAISVQLRNAADTADATSPVNVYGLAGETRATVAAVLRTSGGGGDLRMVSKSGDLDLVDNGGKNELRVRANTSPQDSPGRVLALTAVLDDDANKGGFLTEPLTVLATVNYIVVPGVVLNLNRGGNPIADVVTLYGVESVARTEKIADIAASGGSGNVTATLRTSGADATTPNAFAISGNDLNLSRTFPAFGNPATATAAVVANDSGANAAVTPQVEKRATARLLPVRDKLQPGGNVDKAARNPNNVVSPTSPSATEGEFTVYVLKDDKEAGVIARVGAASAADNAAVEGLSGLRVNAPTRHSSSGTGLQFEQSGNDTNVLIVNTTTPTSDGVDLTLVLEYNDSGHPVSLLTAPLLKTVRVHYETVAPFVPQFRNVDDSTIPDGEAVTAYVAAGATDEVRVARLNQIGGANGMGIVSQSGRLELKNINGVFYAVVPANTGVGSTLHLTVRMDDAPNAADNSPEKAQGSRTPEVELRLTAAYLETRDVQASFADITGNNHFLGTADSSSGVRTLYFKASESRPSPLNILRINISGGSETYTTNTNSPFGLDGFALNAGTGANNRVLALLAAKADGAMARATVEIDDSGAGSDISKPATLTALVAVKNVTAIAAKFVDSSDNSDLGNLRVMSADAAVTNSVLAASVSVLHGVGGYDYARQSESSAELLLNDDGEVHLAGNYTPDGTKTLSIIVAVNDSADGSTLTEAATMTLRFVLAETVRATAFLRGEFLPTGAGNDVAVSEARTIRVKREVYNQGGQVAFGIRPSGGFGAPFAVSKTGNGLSADDTDATASDGAAVYPLRVVVDSGLSPNNAPATLAATLIVNDGKDTGNLTDGATLTVSVVYDKVDKIAAAFQTTTGDPIGGVHVVVRDAGASNTPLHVANVVASDGVGDEGGGNSYTYTQSGTGDLLVNEQGQVMVAARVVPKLTDNDLVATVVIDDSGNWAHVSEPLTMMITVRYSSKLVLVADINDPRANAVPSVIPITEAEGAPAKIYFPKAGTDAGQTLAQLTFRGGKDDSTTYSAAATLQNGLTYNDTTKQILMTKCTDSPAALKSIRLVVNDSPDADGVSDPLTLNITVESGADECIDAISARPEVIVGNGRGAHITGIPKFYRLAGDDLDADLPVATVHVEGGAPDYVSGKSGGELNLVKGGHRELTVVIPSGMTAAASPNNLDIVLTVNDTSDKGGFVTEPVTVEMTVDFAEVQPHGQFTADKVGVVLGEVSSGVLTVRRVAQQSGAFDILTNMRGANAAAERIQTAGGSFVGIRLEADLNNANANKLVMAENQKPDGAVRVITVRVVDYALNPNADLQAQFEARPDLLFTLSVHYLGELEGAAYDTEADTATKITSLINRYAEQGDSEVAVAVASLSVSGGTPPHTYTLVGGLELNADSTTVQIPASATATMNAGTTLTARIVIDDNSRTDTEPLTLDLTAKYILIDGHSDLVATPFGGSSGDLSSDAYPLIVAAQSNSHVVALSGVDFKTALSGATLSRVDGDTALLFDKESKEVRVAGDTVPTGQTLTLKLLGSDGDGDGETKARNDRFYAVAVRYLKTLTAKALDAESGTEINAAREIRVTEAEATETHFVAHITVDGGAGGNVIEVGGTNFVISGNELRIAADVDPGDLATGKLLTATVKVNDDESAVGGAGTDEVAITLTANYVTLPPVEGSFVDGRDGTPVSDSQPVTVFSKHTLDPAPVTLAAVAKATVTGRENDTFTFSKIGGGILLVDKDSGEITVPSRRPQNGEHDTHIITVEFSTADAVASRQTLTVVHQMVRPILSLADGFQSRIECHGNTAQVNSNATGSLITVILPPAEEDTVYEYPNDCAFFASGLDTRIYFDQPQRSYNLGFDRSVQTTAGLEVYANTGGQHAVRLARDTDSNTVFPTFTDGDQTLSIVIAYDDKGPGSHVTDTFLRTVYVVFPGVPKIAAEMQDLSGNALTDPLTILVAAAGENNVAKVTASGGAGTGFAYSGEAINGSTLLVVGNNGQISTPPNWEPLDRPGVTATLAVTVNDQGGSNAAGLTATGPQTVSLTLVYIKLAGTLVAEAVIANPAFADAAATTFYSEAGKTLTAPIDVARIAPTGGLPPYNYAVVGGQNADLGISRASGTDVQVQLKVDDTPSAADRVVTLEVSDSADLATPPADVSTLSLTLTVKFVGVAAHNDLAITRESGIAVNSNGEYVAVRAGAQNEAVNLLSGISTNGTLSRPEGDAGGDAELVWTYASNSGRLAISVGTKPEGKTLSVVLSASDGEATPQKAARQDRLYTISVRYVPAIEAGVRSTTDAALGDADVVELTVLQGVHLVGSISVSGGVGGAYSYTATPATLGGTTLHVDSEGNIRIPTTLAPVAGDGLSITVNIAVDDDKESTDTDRDATSPANVQIRVKYVELEDLALTAKNLQGADVGATDSVGTFYLLEGKTLTAAVLVATVTASGGIKDYIYAVEGGGGDLTFDLSTREVHIAKDKAAQTPGTAGATLSVKVKATDKRGETATLTLRAVFETVPAHPLVEFQPAANSSGKYVVVRAGAQLTAVNVARFEIPPEDALTKTEGDDALVLAAGQVQITANHRPTGKTLTAIITQTDGNDDAREIARPDRLYTISVRYVPAIEARVEDASNAEIAAVVELTVKKGAHFVGSVSVSGGVGGDYSYTPTGVGTSQNLEVDDDGNIRIPTTLEPVAGVGLSITVNIRVDDDENSADSDRDATLPVDVKITVKYVLLESPEIEAQTPAGVRLDSTNTPTFYRLAGATSTADITAAKVVGRKGKSPYTFAIVDADAQGVANGLAVESNGNIVLKSGATPAAGANANRVVTVRLSDSQRPTAETAEVELTVRFEQVETHADVVFTPQSGVTQNDAKEYRVVQAGAPGANVHVLDLASGGDTLSKTEGDADLVLVAGSPNRLEIASSAPRDGRTLTAEITQTDSDDTTPQAIERPDRNYTVSVRYIPAIEARVEDASNAEIAAVVELTAKQGAHLVGSVSVSGGVGGDYSYVATGVDTSQNLEVDADGNIRIPATLAPVAGDGLSITVNIAVDDDKDSAASDRDATSPANVRITVKYVELESPEIEARDKDGTAALTAPTGSNAAVFYQLSGVALPADLAVAKVVGSKGKLPYAFAIVDENGQVQANAKGLEVNSGTGDITLVSGESTTQTGTAADRVITVRLSDNQRPTAETADATLTIRFEAVAPHPDLTGETGGAHVQSFDLSDNLLTVLVDAGETGKQAVVTNVAVAAIAPAAAPTLTKITGNLNFDASAKEISIPDGTDPTGENLSVVLSASDGTDPPQAEARPDKTYSLTVRYLSHVGLSFVDEVGNSLDVTTSGINVRRTAGTTPASVFVASLSASGGAGSYNYSISGHTETGKTINFDTNSNILWIPSSFVPSTSGVRVDIVVTANDNEAITDEARQEIQITYTEAPADPLSGDFVAAAPSSNSRIVGAFDDSKRVTVYGVEADGTSDDLPVMTLSHSNNAVAVSKETGELNYASGQVVIPKAMRKKFGTEFTGVFLATDRRAATADARYSLTVLLAQQLSGTAEGEELFVDAGREAGHANPRRGQYFYTDGRENAAEFRPVLSFPNITVEGLAARSANNNFQWDFATKQMRRNGAPETNHAADELVTLIDPAANPKILPAPLTLDVRNRELPVLSFVSPESTATEIPHTATPTTPVWTFRVKGGALTRKPYRPFHNLTLSPTGAFVVAPATPPRVDDTADTDGESEFADFDVRVDFTHADAALRRGQTLTVTVTAEDIGYPGLGAVSHVAEVVLEAEPIPHLQAGVWTPVASGATQITQPVTVTAKLSTSHNVASVSVSRGRPANNQRYTYTGQRINGTGDALTLSEHGVITIPPSTAPLPTPGLTVTLMVTADDTGHPETDPAEVRVTVVYVLQEVLQAGVRNLDGSSLSGTPIIYRLADEPAPVDGLNVVQVVARGGRAPYRYFVHEDSNPGNLIVKDNGIVAIAADETPDVSGTRLVTVRVEDNQDGDLKETAFATITMNFRAVARHSDLQISMASGIVTNSAGQYIAVRAGAQNEEVALLSVQVDNADSLSKSGDNALLFNKHASTDVYRLRIAPGTEPTGQTL